MQRIATLLACLAALWTWAEGDEFEIKVYSAAKADTPIVVDGKLDEPAWQTAISVGGFTLYGKPTKSEPPTFWKATYDDRYLYLGITCDEPSLDKLQPVPQARDAHAVFSGETIEIFVDPNHTQGTYYQFAANAAGSTYDSRGEDPVWNAATEAATTRTATGWTLEFAIPWADLGMRPRPGGLLGINVCRDRQIDGKQWTNWSRVIHGFHDPPRFGHLILSPKPGMVEKLGDELRKGGRQGPIVIYSQDGFRAATYRGLLEESLARVDAHLASLQQLADKEKNAAVREELAKSVAAYRQKLAPLRTEMAALATIGAEEYTRLDLGLIKLGTELAQAAWEARLRALLQSI
jgi:hypothetical protein